MSVRRALAWSFSGQFSSFLLSFAGSVMVARLLTPHEMGIFTVAASTVAIIGVVTTSGIGAYVVRARELDEGTVDCAFTINALLACVMTFGVYLASLAAGDLTGEPSTGRVLRWLALAPIVALFEFRPATMLQREMQFKTLSVVSSIKTAVGIVTTVSMATMGRSYMSMAYGALASATFGAVAFNVVAHHHASMRLSLAGWRPMVAFSVRMMSISGVAVTANRLSDVVLGRTLGLAALGLYSRAASISNLIFDNVYGAATRVIFVQLATEYRDTGKLRVSFLRGFEMITAVFWPMLVGLAILARPVVYLVYGEKWMAAALPLSLLMVAQVLVLCFGMNWELFVLRDETARQTKIEFFRAGVGFVTFAVGCLFNIAAAALGRIAEALTGLLLYRTHLTRLAEATPRDIAGIYARSGQLTVAAVLPSVCLMFATGWSHRTSPALIACTVSAGVGLWLVVLRRLDHPLFDELRRVVHRLSAGSAPSDGRV